MPGKWPLLGTAISNAGRRLNSANPGEPSGSHVSRWKRLLAVRVVKPISDASIAGGAVEIALFWDSSIAHGLQAGPN